MYRIIIFLLFISFSIKATNNINERNSGYYLGGKLGSTLYKNACGDESLECHNLQTSLGFFLGYRFSDTLSIEGGYNDLGKVKANYISLSGTQEIASYSATVKGYEFAIKSDIYHNNNSLLFSKLGGYYWEVEKKGDEIIFSVNEKNKGTSLALGVGYEYLWTKHLSTRIEYQWFNNVGGRNTGGSDINNISLGLSYHFSSQLNPKSASSIIKKKYFKNANKNEKINIYFNSDSYALTNSQENKLTLLLSYLKKNNNIRIYLHGHTDSTHTEVYNYELSKKRTETILHYFLKYGIEDKRFNTFAFGQTNPVMSNTTKNGRKLNRRVEIHLVQE